MELLDTFNGIRKQLVKESPRIYICGPTVYDDSHLGHARVYITFDLMRRVLTMLGFNPIVAMNITDIDDKIINKAEELNIFPEDLAKRYEINFLKDMESLNIQLPDILTRVRDHINEIIVFIQKLIDKGSAYIDEEGVRFNLDKYLSFNIYPGFNLPIQDKNRDFYLWKFNTKGLKFDSPFGTGRPGWHIECSTMATSVFKDSLDIHVGGIDLAFPHHANEIAQTQSLTEKPWVDIFLHIGHLSIEGKKMSKSLKNFITIREILKDYDNQVIRMYFALRKYNSPMSFSYNSLDEAKSIWETFQSFWRRTNNKFESKWSERDQVILDKLESTRKINIKLLNNDFDIPGLINNILEIIATVNIELTSGISISASFVSKYTKDIMNKLGFKCNETNDLNHKIIQTLVDFRSEVKNNKDKNIYNLTDKVRTELFALGIKIEDQGKLSYWSI